MFSRQKGRLGLRGQFVLCTAAASLGWSLCTNAKATIKTIDPPNSVETRPTSISKGVIAGYFWTTANGFDNWHGFVRDTGGTYTLFDPPGSTDTEAYSINSVGASTGHFVDSSGQPHGFVRTADGTITTFDGPGARSTLASGINKNGVITGDYLDTAWHGFLRKPSGRIKTFDVAGASKTQPVTINDDGVIVGTYSDPNDGRVHGFVRTADGTITTFDPPDSIQTDAYTINGKGTVAGDYYDSQGEEHGYLRAADGTITTFDLSLCDEGFYVVAMNNKGGVTGSCAESNDDAYHGFLRTADGKLRIFDPQGSRGTQNLGMDGSDITGYYWDGSTNHGFLRTP